MGVNVDCYGKWFWFLLIMVVVLVMTSLDSYVLLLFVSITCFFLMKRAVSIYFYTINNYKSWKVQRETVKLKSGRMRSMLV